MPTGGHPNHPEVPSTQSWPKGWIPCATCGLAGLVVYLQGYEPMCNVYVPFVCGHHTANFPKSALLQIVFSKSWWQYHKPILSTVFAKTRSRTHVPTNWVLRLCGSGGAKKACQLLLQNQVLRLGKVVTPSTAISAWCCSLFWGVVSLQVRFLNMLGVVCGQWYFASFVLVGFDAGRVSGWQLYKTFQICYCYITQITIYQVYSHFPSQLISTWKLAQNHQLDFRPSASMLRKPEVDSSLETPHAPQTVHALCSCVHREGLAMARVILTPTPKALSSSTSFEGPPWDYLRAFDGDLFPHVL